MLAALEERGFRLQPENAFEEGLLRQAKTRSRLAFRTGPPQASLKNFWRFQYGDSFHVDFERRLASLPCLGREEGQYRYWPRVLMDYIALQKACLSLHCAVIAFRDMRAFIVAPSGFGKSQLAHELASHDPEMGIICDDHCFVLDGYLQGNSLGRLRGERGDSYFAALGEGCWQGESSVIVSIETGEGRLERLAAQDFASDKILLAALKYLWEEPKFKPEHFDELLKNRKFNQELFSSFLAGLRGCYKISGDIHTQRALMTRLLGKGYVKTMC